MTTVLLADRDGHALGPLAEKTVPALLPLRGAPILERALESLVSAGIRSALVVVGPRAVEVEKRFGKGIRWGIALEYVRREEDESTGAVLRRLEHRLDGDTFVLRGDAAVEGAFGEFVGRAARRVEPVVAAVSGKRLLGMWRIRPEALKKTELPRDPADADWMLDTGHAPARRRPRRGAPRRPSPMVRARPRRGEARPLAPRDRGGLREAHRRDDGRGGGGRPRKGHARRRVGPAADRHSRGGRALRRRRLAEPRRRPGDGCDVAPHRPSSSPPRAARSGVREPARRPRPLPPFAPALARRPRLVARRQRGAREEALLVRRQRREAGDARAGPARSASRRRSRSFATFLSSSRSSAARSRSRASRRCPPRRRRTRARRGRPRAAKRPWGSSPVRGWSSPPRLHPRSPASSTRSTPATVAGASSPSGSRRSSRRAPGRRRRAGIPTVSPRRKSSCSALPRTGGIRCPVSTTSRRPSRGTRTNAPGSLASGTGHLSTTFGGAPSLGGRVDRTNPEELLLGALLACFVQTWAIFLAKLRLPIESPRVDGTLELGVDPAGGYRVDAGPPLRARSRCAPRRSGRPTWRRRSRSPRSTASSRRR